MNHEVKDAINDALAHQRRQLQKQLAEALGFGLHPESAYLGTWDDLVSIVAKQMKEAVETAQGTACVAGMPCGRHGGVVHGQEAEELRAGIEKIRSCSDDLTWRDDIRMLLDEVDARDSLAFLEKTDRKGDIT